MNPDILNPPAAHGQPLFNAVLKQRAEDFRVDEMLELDFSGSGEHLYLQLEKTSMNTDELTALLQQVYKVSSADIGYCGLKDRHSVSTQWFSIRTPDSASVMEQHAMTYNEQERAQWGDSSAYLKAIQVLRSERHSRKLKRGAHKGNRFVITLRDVEAFDVSLDEQALAVPSRVEAIILHGFPAYIGTQRFGHGGQNLQRARQWFGRAGKRTSRQQRSLWLSAARSAVFNTVCAARVRNGSWLNLMEGEPAMLDGTGSYFVVEGGDSTLTQRLGSRDIHPSAPWWGRGRAAAQGECADYEQGVLKPLADLCAGLERAGLPQERRALRGIAQGLSVEWASDTVIQLKFSLPPGIFATALLRELGSCVEPIRNTD